MEFWMYVPVSLKQCPLYDNIMNKNIIKTWHHHIHQEYQTKSDDLWHKVGLALTSLQLAQLAYYGNLSAQYNDTGYQAVY